MNEMDCGLKEISSTSSNKYLSKIKTLYTNTCRLLISRDGIGWKVKLTIRLNNDLIWVQANKVNANEMDYGRWNEWDGLWTEGNKMRHDQWTVDRRK